MPSVDAGQGRLSDFYFIHQNDAERAGELIVDRVRNHIPRRVNLDPVDDIQVLTPMHKGAVGAGRMNACLQEALNQELSITRPREITAHNTYYILQKTTTPEAIADSGFLSQ